MILTQIICGDVLKDMYDRVHTLKKKLNMKLDCYCCKKAEIEEIKTPDTVQAEPVKKTPPPKRPQKKEIQPTKFVTSLDQCPVCQKSPLKKDHNPLAPALHMMKHFGKELEGKITSKSPPYTCPQCDWQDEDKINTMLHLALTHNELEQLFRAWKTKKYTLKNIILKVDKAEKCKKCEMNYNEHQMGFPEIRKHLYTHFRNDINEYGVKVGSYDYKCNFQPGCDFETSDKGRMTDHIGIFHGYLDQIVDKLEVKPKKKKLSLSDYAKKNSTQEPIKTEPDTPVKEEPPEPMVIKDHACPVCDIWDSKQNIRKHAMKHFHEEIKELIKDRDIDDVCKDCPYDFDLAPEHLALEHGWIDKLMNDQPTVVDKRKEYFEKHDLPMILGNPKRKLGFDLTQNKRAKSEFKCLLCGTVLPDQDLDYAVNHFATHVWLQLQKLGPKVRFWCFAFSTFPEYSAF